MILILMSVCWPVLDAFPANVYLLDKLVSDGASFTNR
jgi:hypothetical protein